jgi:hypothetical protein
MRLVNCSLLWDVSLLNIRNIGRSVAHSDANSTSRNVESPFVDNGLLVYDWRLEGPLEAGVLGAHCW